MKKKEEETENISVIADIHQQEVYMFNQANRLENVDTSVATCAT